MAETQSLDRKLVGIEASMDAFKAVCIDAAGSVIGTRAAAFDRDREMVEQLAGFLIELRGEFGNFENVGIAIPGLIDRETQKVAFSANIPEHSTVDIGRGLRDASGVNVAIENDANAAAYGEFRLGAGRGSRDMFYATLGSGVGGAFIFDGKIWRGKAGYAGEFGYVAINSEGMRLEDVASSANIVRRTKSRLRQDNTSSLSNIRDRTIGISDIISAAQIDDDLTHMMLERTGEYVGTAVATVINLLNIETIIIGGDIMHARSLVLDSVISRAKELSFGPSFERTKILSGELGSNAAAIGVALIADEGQ